MLSLKNRVVVLVTTLFSISHASVFNRYVPRVNSIGATQEHRTRFTVDPSTKVDLLAEYGMTPGMRAKARAAILKHYTGIIVNSGEEANQIALEMENAFGGYWMVAIFDTDYDAAYTITRRSNNYGLYDIDDRMILVAKDGNGWRGHTHGLI
uniref:Inhibitor_I69 domain-containing protein n=1 Tax=Panagrellus redivivus TaxID=6233 RepID=A0A7E4UYE0_PANRE